MNTLRGSLPGSGPIYSDGSYSKCGSVGQLMTGSAQAHAFTAVVTCHNGYFEGIRVVAEQHNSVTSAHSPELVGVALATFLRGSADRAIRSDCKSVINKCNPRYKNRHDGADDLLFSAFRQAPSSFPTHVAAHPERKKKRDAFTEEDLGIFYADMLAGDPASFARQGGSYREITLDEALAGLQQGMLSTVLLQGTSSLCLNTWKQVDFVCGQRYLMNRDGYRASDILNPRSPRWVGTSLAFASSVWQASGSSMDTCAFKLRLAWDKHYTGRHQNFGKEYDEEIQRCPHCGLSDETQDHILRHCAHPEILVVRTAALRCQGGRIRDLYLKDPATARYIEAYHTLCLGHEEGGSMMTGMLTPAALASVATIPHPCLDAGRLFRDMVTFCRGYRDMAMDIYRIRAQLLSASEMLGKVECLRPRMPLGNQSHLRRSLRPMVSTRTDYPGLATVGGWRDDSNRQTDIREFFGAVTCAADTTVPVEVLSLPSNKRMVGTTPKTIVKRTRTRMRTPPVGVAATSRLGKSATFRTQQTYPSDPAAPNTYVKPPTTTRTRHPGECLLELSSANPVRRQTKLRERKKSV